ncbi:unnamed protein product [Spirodela intermedia]|uniref:Uncharacterized protein n=1 Tax=Spirodela intermedia TaxID=51605 RepID=A0ABN7E978_SPIIN|nr:unnamed protein product [Spirodela intermedia]
MRALQNNIEMRKDSFQNGNIIFEKILLIFILFWLKRKNGDFAALRCCHPTKRSWMEVGRMSGSSSSSGPRSKRRLFITSDTLSGASDPLAGPEIEM